MKVKKGQAYGLRFAIGVMALILFLTYRSERTRYADGVPGTAVITQSRTRSKRRYYEVEVFVNGLTYKGEVQAEGTFRSIRRVGETVPILAQIENPGQPTISSSNLAIDTYMGRHPRSPWLAGLFVPLMVGLGVASLFAEAEEEDPNRRRFAERME